MRKLFTLIRRELWEYKTGFITLPLLCTLILSLLLSVGFLRFAPPPADLSAATATQAPIPNTPDQTSGDLNQQFSAYSKMPLNELPLFSHMDALRSAVGFLGFTQWIVAVVLNFILLIATLNYAHRALFDDRKTREILFWRSMPVSEAENVLAKLSIIYGLAPLMLLGMSFLGGVISWLTAIGHGTQDALPALTKLLDAFSVYTKSLLFLFALLPIITWTLLASAYAKKSPFLLSTFLPLGLILIDRLVHWATGINLYIHSSIGAYTDYLSHFLAAINNGLTLNHLSASIVIILVSTVFTLTAVWLRNNRYEI
ncbi:MAG TPA: hypothetical protein PKD17_11575 [Cellvibrionaceae bacterium]|nr:hypothetical protein [Cellvibrionaceae bacterium]HMW72455.1 hypothetical protein [Cellvibrionaceae bacterium]HMY39774.1 hypothetical protein [Marinagarivorans sp.]HNG60224.1 hypothetical protein [Cellvibrionaceae bacterium]